MEEKLDFGAMPPKPGPDYCFHSCLYNSTQFWQDPSAHTRVLAFMNLLGCECHADWMNSGHKSQTSTMTLFIQTWLPECRLTLCVINFHRPRTSTSTKLRPRRKKKLTERNWAAETSPSRLHFIPWPRHALTDWHALSMPLKFSFSMFSNLCFLLCSCHMKMKQGSGDEEQKSAFNSWPRAGVSHQWLF